MSASNEAFIIAGVRLPTASQLETCGSCMICAESTARGVAAAGEPNCRMFDSSVASEIRVGLVSAPNSYYYLQRLFDLGLRGAAFLLPQRYQPLVAAALEPNICHRCVFVDTTVCQCQGDGACVRNAVVDLSLMHDCAFEKVVLRLLPLSIGGRCQGRVRGTRLQKTQAERYAAPKQKFRDQGTWGAKDIHHRPEYSAHDAFCNLGGTGLGTLLSFNWHLRLLLVPSLPLGHRPVCNNCPCRDSNPRRAGPMCEFTDANAHPAEADCDAGAPFAAGREVGQRLSSSPRRSWCARLPGRLPLLPPRPRSWPRTGG